MTTSIHPAPETDEVTGSPGRGRLRALAVAMMVAPWGYVVANAGYMWAIREGGTDATAAESLQLAAAHPDLLRLVLVAVMVAGILMVPAVLGLIRVAPRSRTVLVGGSMMIAGYVCYAVVAGAEFKTLAMAERGGPVDDYVAVIEAAQADPAALWTFAVFALGNLIGTVVLAIGLFRARTVPRWAALAILSWPVLHVFGLTLMPNEVPQVIGAVLQAIGFAGCARALLRSPG